MREIFLDVLAALALVTVAITWALVSTEARADEAIPYGDVTSPGKPATKAVLVVLCEQVVAVVRSEAGDAVVYFTPEDVMRELTKLQEGQKMGRVDLSGVVCLAPTGQKT